MSKIITLMDHLDVVQMNTMTNTGEKQFTMSVNLLLNYHF